MLLLVPRGIVRLSALYNETFHGKLSVYILFNYMVFANEYNLQLSTNSELFRESFRFKKCCFIYIP